MNNIKHLDSTHPLTLTIQRWLAENDPLKPGETISVSISRGFMPVQVSIADGSDLTAKLIHEAAEVVPYHSIRNMVNSWSEDPSTIIRKIKTTTIRDLRKYRHVGKHALTIFAAALRERGIICDWMDHINDLKA